MKFYCTSLSNFGTDDAFAQLGNILSGYWWLACRCDFCLLPFNLSNISQNINITHCGIIAVGVAFLKCDK